MELLQIRGLGPQIELRAHERLEARDGPPHREVPEARRDALQRGPRDLQERHVALDQLPHAGVDDFDRDLRAGREDPAVDLRDAAGPEDLRGFDAISAVVAARFRGVGLPCVVLLTYIGTNQQDFRSGRR